MFVINDSTRAKQKEMEEQILKKLQRKYNVILKSDSIKLKECRFVKSQEYTENFLISYIKSGKDAELIEFVIEYFYDEKLLRGSEPMRLKNISSGLELPLDSLSSSMCFFISCLINSRQGIYTELKEGIPSYRFLELLDRFPFDILISYTRTDQLITDELSWESVKLAIDYPLYEFSMHKLEVAHFIEYNLGISESEEQFSKEIDLSQFEDPEAFSNGIRVISHVKGQMPVINARKAPMLAIEIKDNGEFVFKTELSMKYPELRDFIYEFGVNFTEEEQHERGGLYSDRSFNGDQNILVVVVDVEETIEKLEDIENTVFGFLYRDNILHIYDRNDILNMFAVRLKASASPSEVAQFFGDDYIGTLYTTDELKAIKEME